MTPLAADMEQTLVRPTESIPGYELLDVVGAGAMGTVFRARQLRLDRIVAVKVIRHNQFAAGARHGLQLRQTILE